MCARVTSSWPCVLNEAISATVDLHLRALSSRYDPRLHDNLVFHFDVPDATEGHTAYQTQKSEFYARDVLIADSRRGICSLTSVP
jgi:hypothetical protein